MSHKQSWTRLGVMATSAAALTLAATAAHAARAPEGPSKPTPPPVTKTFPDWSGAWESPSSLFDLGHGFRTVNDGKARDFPPYTPEWETKYSNFLKDTVWTGKFIDPINLCLPGGYPRILSTPRATAFLVTPEMVVMLKEQGWFRIIYTDGRKMPGEDDMWPTWEGWSVGHWEGDTLVVETKSLRGKVVIDRTGLLLSDKASSVERIRRVDYNTMEDVVTFTDPVALTKPWTVRRTWRREPDDAWIASNHCGEAGDRNPIVGGENTVVLGSEAPKLVGNYPATIAKFSAW
jgi:hypothetical protein